jgi:hypothetical protein
MEETIQGSEPVKQEPRASGGTGGQSVIVIDKLVKQFGKLRAVDHWRGLANSWAVYPRRWPFCAPNNVVVPRRGQIPPAALTRSRVNRRRWPGGVPHAGRGLSGPVTNPARSLCFRGTHRRGPATPWCRPPGPRPPPARRYAHPPAAR